MARTHGGSPRSPETFSQTVRDPRVARPPVVVVGNYVTLRLYNHKAVANNDVRVLQDRIFLPMPFRVSAIATDTLGATATVTAFVDNAATSATLVPNGIVVSDNTQHQSLPVALNSSNRNIARDTSLDLTVSANGTGALPIGGLIVWVTGYFTDWISGPGSGTNANNRVDAAEPGATHASALDHKYLLRVSKRSGPVAGYYDCLSMFNLRLNANQALRQECAITMPYDCRVMRVAKQGKGGTYGTGTKRILLAHSIKGTFIDMTDTGDSEGVVDYTHTFPTMSPTATAVEFARGDLLTLSMSTGVADSVPIGFQFVNIFVWVKGHVAPADRKELD